LVKAKTGLGKGFGDIQIQTGFGEKKLRNIIFRLHKTGKIKRKTRGIYIDNKSLENQS
jgi:DNA-binding transcriptional regulator PaaX